MIVDLYAGPGGWSEGLRSLGLDAEEVGIELDRAACATRAAAGHRTIRADVAQYPPERFAGARGLIASPPCQSFSMAGGGDGRDRVDELLDAIAAGEWYAVDPDRSEGYGHVLEVGRWVEVVRPAWVAFEQVPPCLPLWSAYAARWRRAGWSAWAGVLNSADYGVPQTRKRAFLLARADGRPVGPPEPTHCRGGASTLFGSLEPWVSMADALGWHGEDEPARTLCGDRSPRWLYPDPDGTRGRMVGFPRRSDGRPGDDPEGYRSRDWRADDEPAATVTEKTRSAVVVRRGVKLDRRQGAVDDDGTYAVPVVDCDTEPAPTLTAKALDGVWTLRHPDEPRCDECGCAEGVHDADGYCAGPCGGECTDGGRRLPNSAYVGLVLNPGRTASQPKRNPRPVTEPAPTIAFGRDSSSWAWESPATTVTGDPRLAARCHHGMDGSQGRDARTTDEVRAGHYEGTEPVRLRLDEALVLQSFPADYPLQGIRTKQFEQVGNAVPPALAARVVEAVAA